MTTQDTKIKYRRLDKEEISLDLFAGFERRQEVTKCWRKEDGRWVVKDIAFVDQWSQDEYRFLVQCLVGTICHGGMVCGAFLGDVLKGFVSVEGEKIGSRGQYMDLTSLHVSLDLRGNGVGTALFQRAAAWARQQGAEKLYISGHSAVETQAFYRAMGCVEAEEYQKKHTELEPCDCQLEYRL